MLDDCAQEPRFPPPTRGADGEREEVKAGHPPHGPNEGHVLEKGKIRETAAGVVGVPRGEERLVPLAVLNQARSDSLRPARADRSAAVRTDGIGEGGSSLPRALRRTTAGCCLAPAGSHVCQGQRNESLGVRARPRRRAGAAVATGRQNRSHGLPRSPSYGPAASSTTMTSSGPRTEFARRSVSPAALLIDRGHDNGESGGARCGWPRRAGVGPPTPRPRAGSSASPGHSLHERGCRRQCGAGRRAATRAVSLRHRPLRLLRGRPRDRDADADMVNAGAPSVEEAGDGAISG